MSLTKSTQERKPSIFSICLAGDHRVGKTSIVNRLNDIRNPKLWQDHWQYLIGIDFFLRKEKFDDQDVKIIVFDAVQRFWRIDTSYFRHCNGIILIYDITNRSSFEEIENRFEGEKITSKEPSHQILIGNKVDLEEERKVSYEEGRLLAEKLGGIEFFEISAKTTDGVEHAFKVISKKILEKNREYEGMEKKKTLLNLKNQTEKKRLFFKIGLVVIVIILSLLLRFGSIMIAN